MNFAELINENVSKKMGIAVTAMITLVYVNAPSWQIAFVATVAIIIQGILDFKKTT